jgi:hypothetical protein
MSEVRRPWIESLRFTMKMRSIEKTKTSKRTRRSNTESSESWCEKKIIEIHDENAQDRQKTNWKDREKEKKMRRIERRQIANTSIRRNTRG